MTANVLKMAYRGEVPWHGEGTELTAGASNAWTTDCKDLIRAFAARTVALRTLHDAELAAMQATIEQTEYMRLIDENDRRTTTGAVPPVY